MQALRADYTEVWCADRNAPLARFADAAQSIVASGLDGLGLLPSAHVAHVIARLRDFDSVISWYGSARPEFRELVRDLGLPFTFLPALPDGREHAIDFYNRQARELGAGMPSRFPRIDCPAVDRIFAAIHPFASSPAKRAPMAAFERAAERLAAHMPVRWFCGPEENLDGATRIENLYELACTLRGARIFVGNDSGISHLAAAVVTPVLAFFQSTDPRVWSPRGVSAISYSEKE